MRCRQRARWTRPSPATGRPSSSTRRTPGPTSTWAPLCDIKRDYDEAIACFRKAIELDPKDAMAHNNLGDALRQKGQVDEAIACYRKAIELDPKYAAAHCNLGTICSIPSGDYEAAIACYRKAIELDPKYALAHYNLGNALRGQGPGGRGHRLLPEGHRARPEGRRGPHQPGVILCDIKRRLRRRPSSASARPSN